MIIAFLGKAGSGKDTAADYLCRKYRFKKIAFADPLKRFCQDVFDFSHEQLWGPSEMRNKPDPRYPRIFKDEEIGPDGETESYLTPRFALQTLGTEWGRNCYKHVWVDYAIRVAKRLLEDRDAHYSPDRGIYYEEQYRHFKGSSGVVISDCRFKNEVQRLREQGGKVVKLIRSGIGELSAGVQNHASEMEQDGINDKDVDEIVYVPEGKEAFYSVLDLMMEHGK